MTADIFKVYCADHTYSTLRLPMDSSVGEIVMSAKDKLCLGDDPVLCEVKSNGGMHVVWVVLKQVNLSVTSHNLESPQQFHIMTYYWYAMLL